MEIKVVRIKASYGFCQSQIDAEKEIKKMYDEGYTLKATYPSVTQGYGRITAVDFVFERQETK